MKTFKTLFAVAMCSLLLAACAKKDNEFAAKYKKNAMGATARNAEAAAAAAASGILFDVVGLTTVNKNQSNPISFQATLMLDNQTQSFVASLSGTTPMPVGTTTIAGSTIRVEGVCGTYDCNPFYLMATAFKNNVRYAQVGYKFFRLNQTADQDIYQLFDANTALPDLQSMVNELNKTPQ